MPAKILDTPSWNEVVNPNGKIDRVAPATRIVLDKAAKDIADTGSAAWKALMWFVHTPGVIAAPVVDAVWSTLNTAVNWYKKLYNVWADLYNRAENAILDRKRANTKQQPIWKAMPQQPVVPADADTDAQLREATHQFWYGNDPRTVYQRYRKWKKVPWNNAWKISL